MNSSTGKRKAAIYARVSTAGQHVSMQVHELKEFAERRGFELYAIYEETASGAKDDRKQYQKMMAAAKRKEFDVVICYRFDRVARSLRQLVYTLDELSHMGVGFISLHEDVDTSTPNGRLVFGVIAAVAEFEREIIRDRIRSGFAEAKRKGRKFGPARQYMEYLPLMQKLRAEGRSFGEIEKDLNIPKPTIARMLKEAKERDGQTADHRAEETDRVGETAEADAEADTRPVL